MKDLKHYQQQAKLSRARKHHEQVCADAIERAFRPILDQSSQRFDDLASGLARERERLHASILKREQAHPHLRKIATLQTFTKLIESFVGPYTIQFDLGIE